VGLLGKLNLTTIPGHIAFSLTAINKSRTMPALSIYDLSKSVSKKIESLGDYSEDLSALKASIISLNGFLKSSNPDVDFTNPNILDSFLRLRDTLARTLEHLDLLENQRKRSFSSEPIDSRAASSVLKRLAQDEQQLTDQLSSFSLALGSSAANSQKEVRREERPPPSYTCSQEVSDFWQAYIGGRVRRHQVRCFSC
jgi:hypothetical protein